MKLTLISICLLMATLSTAQVRNNVVIDEIMADPNPSAGLPEVEFIELTNVSGHPVDLHGWKICDAGVVSTINVHFILHPDSFVIVCGISAVSSLSAHSSIIGVSNFPSLDNDGELLYIRSREGTLIHAVEYKKSWYRNAVKGLGGWTLEMIDTRNPCSGLTNWQASSGIKGGTPGKRNSVDAVNKDVLGPEPIKAFAADSLSVTVVFDEPLDSLSATSNQNFSLSEGIGLPTSVSITSLLFNRVTLKLNHALKPNKSYTLEIQDVADCSGNVITPVSHMTVGLPVSPGTSDIVINEILFNPPPDGVDYVELYNRSNNIIDIKDLYLANRETSGVVTSIIQLSAESQLIFPGEYLLISEDALIITRRYIIKNPRALIELAAMPSYPDSKGTVVLMSIHNKVIDQLQYEEKWHFQLIENYEGVALERIDYNTPTQDPANWHSASTSSGYGTPGFQNSQFRTGNMPEGMITVDPQVFSPDNDGFQDVLTIAYKFDEPGYVCNITMYNADGRPVRYLTRNALCGLNGYYRWDGLDESKNKLNIGIYIMVADVFNLTGKVKKFRHAVVLARQLR